MSLHAYLSDPVVWAAILTVVAILQVLRTRNQDGLNRFNGPPLAALTNLWRLSQAYWYNDRIIYSDLTTRYGEIVRIGPRSLLFQNPNAIKDIYGGALAKSDHYEVATSVSRGTPVATMFSSADKEWHRKLRRAVSNAFSLSTMMQYEDAVNATVVDFLRQLDLKFVQTGTSVNLSEWFNFLAIEVVGHLTYGSSLGMLERGYDHLGFVDPVHKVLRYFSVVNNFPMVDRILWKNPVLMWLGRKGWYSKRSPTVPFTLSRVEAKKAELTDHKSAPEAEPKHSDLLTKFLRAKEEHPETITDKEVLINAGSDTTATTLSACFFHLLRQPSTLKRLSEEIDAHFPPPRSGFDDLLAEDGPVRYQDAVKLPYLDACVKETFRMHPSLGGMVFERITPPEGATICGELIPGNTRVCMNAWTTHRYKALFGEDADYFRPERWLECSTGQAAVMNKSLLHFGSGPHTCIGKSIALMELYKIIPSMLRTYTMRPAGEEASYTLNNIGIAELSGFFVQLSRRQTDPSQ